MSYLLYELLEDKLGKDIAKIDYRLENKWQKLIRVEALLLLNRWKFSKGWFFILKKRVIYQVRFILWFNNYNNHGIKTNLLFCSFKSGTYRNWLIRRGAIKSQELFKKNWNYLLSKKKKFEIEERVWKIVEENNLDKDFSLFFKQTHIYSTFFNSLLMFACLFHRYFCYAYHIYIYNICQSYIYFKEAITIGNKKWTN